MVDEAVPCCIFDHWKRSGRLMKGCQNDQTYSKLYDQAVKIPYEFDCIYIRIQHTNVFCEV